MVSARPRPTDAGITTSRAVLFRKLSMRCRTSCSFITHDHGTAFPVHRMLKKTGGSGAFLGKADCVLAYGLYRFSASCYHGFLNNIETMQATW
jgi:hypothetical protein